MSGRHGRFHSGGPPWRHWKHGPPPDQAGHGWQHRRRFLFWRFAVTFGFIALLAAGGMAVLAFLTTRLFGGDGPTAVFVWVAGCSLSLALPLLALNLAIRAFRGIATPLAAVMSAADAVAEGDLSARVPENGRGEFDRLAHSFNRMVSQLERADQQRRNLTADVAHELRTPLHVIQGNLEGILDGVYEPTPAHIEATLEETRLLARLVEDLRTLSLAEAGQLALRLEQVDVAELLADAATTFSLQAEAAGITLTVAPSDAPLTVSADPARLDQVLGNLLSNALRHTPPGGTITLEAEALPAGVRLLVRDTGEGIAPDDLPYIFDRFWRADRARSHAGGVGGGLGLAIARQLIEAHGGTIGVESTPGQGTTFTIELPG